MDLGMGEILLILLVALLVYGGRLPEVATAVGKSLGELRRSLRQTGDMVRRELQEESAARPRPGRRLIEDRPEGAEAAIEPGQPAPDELAQEDISIPDASSREAPQPDAP